MKKLYFTLLIASVLAGCTKGESENAANSDLSSAISPNANVEASTTTKAAVEGTAFPANTDNVFRLTTYAGSAAPVTDWSAAPYFNDIQVNSGDASALTLTPAQYYPANGDKVFFYAYAPEATSLTAGTASSAPVANYTITGQEDIMAAQEVSGIAKVRFDETQDQPTLPFTHKLMQVRFKVKADVSFETGKKVSEILVKNLKTSAKLNIATGMLVFDGWATYDLSLPIVPGTKDEVTIDGTEMDNGVMFEPVGTAGTVLLKVTVDGVIYDDIEVVLTGNGNGQAGTSHLVTLTFKRSGITTSATITDWVNTGSGSSDVGGSKTYPYVLYGRYIVSKDRAGSITYPIHANWSVTPAHDETNSNIADAVSARLEIAEGDATVDGRTTMNWYIASGTVDATHNPDGKAACTNGWRLPTRGEMASAYEQSYKGTLTVSALGLGYWCRTESGSNPNEAWYVLHMGLPHTGTKDQEVAVRCVRDNAYPYTVDGKTIVSKDANGSSAGPFHENWVTTPAHNESDAANAVSARFEVATENALNPADGSPSMNWYIASGTVDATLNPDGLKACIDGWRLPTRAELALIYTQKEALTASPIPVFSFWSATEDSLFKDAAYCISSGVNDSVSKGNTFNVRCVRDILLP